MILPWLTKIMYLLEIICIIHNNYIQKVHKQSHAVRFLLRSPKSSFFFLLSPSYRGIPRMSFTHLYRVLNHWSITHLRMVLNVHISCRGSLLPYYPLGEYGCRSNTGWKIEIPINSLELPLPCSTFGQAGRLHAYHSRSWVLSGYTLENFAFSTCCFPMQPYSGEFNLTTVFFRVFILKVYNGLPPGQW